MNVDPSVYEDDFLDGDEETFKKIKRQKKKIKEKNKDTIRKKRQEKIKEKEKIVSEYNSEF